MNHVATLKDKFLENFYLKGKRSVAKARAEGPAAYVFPGDDPRPGQQARLLRQLQAQGVEVHRADKPFKIKDADYPAGSYVVRMDQPYSRMADMMLDRQYFNVNDPAPYDDVGWTLGPLYNVRTVRIEDVAVLDAPMTLVAGAVAAPGGVSRPAKGAVQAYLVNHNADNVLATFRFAHRDLKIQAAEKDFEAPGPQVPGRLVRHQARRQSRRTSRPSSTRPAKKFGFAVVAAAARSPPFPPTRSAPRASRSCTPGRTPRTRAGCGSPSTNCGIPYDYISVHAVRDNAKLRDKYDVILFGPSSSDPFSIVNGVTRRQAPALEEDRPHPEHRRRGLDRRHARRPRARRRHAPARLRQGRRRLHHHRQQLGAARSTSAWPRDWPSTTRPSSGPAAASTRRPSATGRARSPTATTTRLGIYFSQSPVFAMGGTGGRARGLRRRRPAVRRAGSRAAAARPTRTSSQGRPRDLGQKTDRGVPQGREGRGAERGRRGEARDRPRPGRPAARRSELRRQRRRPPHQRRPGGRGGAGRLAGPGRRDDRQGPRRPVQLQSGLAQPDARLLLLHFQRLAQLEGPRRQGQIKDVEGTLSVRASVYIGW
ncbi:MAG: hypothetical protein MZV63_65300 [Marinilabiliales bacterium]|nr:hypothetical protein [Marinilabiliales bacterium]